MNMTSYSTPFRASVGGVQAKSNSVMSRTHVPGDLSPNFKSQKSANKTTNNFYSQGLKTNKPRAVGSRVSQVYLYIITISYSAMILVIASK